MRWPRQCRARKMFAGRISVSEHSAPDEQRCADGKTVWSWRPLLASSRRRSCEAQPGFAWAFNPAATEARGIRLRGERDISLKTTAQGMPECSDCTCMLVCAFLAHYCTRDRGCSKHPAFPAPSCFLGAKDFCKPRAKRAARTRRCARCRRHRHCERSEAIHLATQRRMDCFRFAPRNAAYSRASIPVGPANAGTHTPPRRRCSSSSIATAAMGPCVRHGQSRAIDAYRTAASTAFPNLPASIASICSAM